SAKLVLESKPALLRQFWLCELEPQRVERLHELKADQPVNKRRTIDVVPGDFNANVAGLLKTSKIDEAIATFCLLDQRTFECEWQTLVRYRATRKLIRSSSSTFWEQDGLTGQSRGHPPMRLKFSGGGGVRIFESFKA